VRNVICYGIGKVFETLSEESHDILITTNEQAETI